MKDNLTQYDEEQLLGYEIHLARKRLFELNRRLKFYQITSIDITHSEVMTVPHKLWYQKVIDRITGRK